MAFFKFRKGGDESAAAPVQPESVETLRRRARHRLIGAAVLVGVGVLGFPLLFDTQPRPIDADIPIEIPDRNKAKPLALPQPVSATPTAPAAQPAAGPAPVPPLAATAAAAPARPVASGAVTSAGAPARPESRPEPASQAKAEARVEPKVEAKVEARPESRDAPKPLASATSKSPPAAPVQAAARPAADTDTARARALLEGKPAPAAAAAAAEGRFVVQVGAFADPSKARETRLRVERAGLKTYTHVAETKGGKRIRVRVGPFETRAQADKAAGRIKELDLPAAILTL